MLSAVGLVYGLAAFTPTRVLNGRSGTPLHTHTGFGGLWQQPGVQSGGLPPSCSQRPGLHLLASLSPTQRTNRLC